MRLRDYQQEGLGFLYANPRCILADDMGLGKTVQAIELINLDKTIKRVIVICPKSLVLYWRQELDRNLSSVRALRTDWVVTNYEQIDKIDWSQPESTLLIIDEGHYLKGVDSKRSTKVRALSTAIRRIVILTGTPTPNGQPAELWPLLNIIAPDKWNDFHTYGVKFCAGHNRVVARFQNAKFKAKGYPPRERRAWDYSGSSNEDELKAELKRVMLRRLKTDILKELPPKTRQLIPLQVGRGVNDGDLLPELSFDTYEACVKRLKTNKVLFAEWSRRRVEQGKAKIPLVCEHIEDSITGGKKVLVFAHHREVIDAIHEKLSQDSINVVVVDGRETQREDKVRYFNGNPDARVLIGSFGTMAVGWNITATSHGICAELDPVPATMNQLEDRMHGLGRGTGDPVLIQHLIVDGSLDARIAKILVRKQETITRIIDT